MKRVFYLTTEAVPLAKTGGLADVCGALPMAVQNDPRSDFRCSVIMPAFRSIWQSGLAIEPTDVSFAIDMGDQTIGGTRLIGGRLLRTSLPNPDGLPVPVWLIDQPMYYDREGLYGPPGDAYEDNAERFIFFVRSAIAVLRRMVGGVDLVHCNDWQTGLFPAIIRDDPVAAAAFERTATLLTIHNLAYQGHFGSETFPTTGLPWDKFRSESFEYYGGMNFLKTGIVTADAISTVSQRYAAEIQTPEMGCGLESILHARRHDLTGIVNGIDSTLWDPATDPHLAVNYDRQSWRSGKAANKRALQFEMNIAPDPDVPLIGLVGRLASQKGWDLIVPVMRQHLVDGRPVQWAVLGSGDADHEASLRRLAEMFPAGCGVHIGFDEGLAHRIEAACDLFLMPSQYEPCGLNQLYSLRYGSVPVVTPVGGLADTVVDATPQTMADRTATGFHIRPATIEGLDATIGRALATRHHDRETFETMIETAMGQDWSWDRSGRAYAELYEGLIDRRSG